MKGKELLDIVNIKGESDLVKERLLLLEGRFIALALDYKQHIDTSFEEKNIYILRDSIQFRLASANFHLELLFNHLSFVEKRAKEELGMGLSTNSFRWQVTSLFDSFVYHTVSVFDYLGSLVNYIGGKKKDSPLMWTRLAKSVRDKENNLSRTNFSKVIDQIDKEFVCKLYDYRSSLIHRKADIIGYQSTYTPGGHEEVVINFYAGKQLTRSFADLKNLTEKYDLTVSYVAFWVLNGTIDKITDILFSLKKEIESKSKGEEPTLSFLHPETGERMSVSVAYWNEALYEQGRS